MRLGYIRIVKCRATGYWVRYEFGNGQGIYKGHYISRRAAIEMKEIA